jgi:GTP pyrophosphokinase
VNTPAHPPTDNPPKVKGKVRAGAVHVAAANATAASFAALTARLDYLTPADIEQVRLAYRFADEAHLGQLRTTVSPYRHPIAVAAQCADWRLDAQALMAALLHDAIEDCGVTKSELMKGLARLFAELVDGLTVDRLHFNTGKKARRVFPQDAAGHGPWVI